MSNKHAVKHDLAPDVAKRVLEKALESYKERFPEYSPTSTWKGDSRVDVNFSVKGMKVDGRVDLEPGQIVIDLDVPFLLKPFKKQAVELVEAQIHKWIKRSKDGEI
jgi:hypothetical protein